MDLVWLKARIIALGRLVIVGLVWAVPNINMYVTHCARHLKQTATRAQICLFVVHSDHLLGDDVSTDHGNGLALLINI